MTILYFQKKYETERNKQGKPRVYIPSTSSAFDHRHVRDRLAYCCLQNSWHSCEIDQNVHFHLFSLFLNAQPLISNSFSVFGM